MKTRVLKFGGTSVGRLEALRTAFEIVERTARETTTVVVVSAIAGTTTELDRLAATAARGELDAASAVEHLRRRHLEHLAAVASGAPERAARARVAAQLARLGELLAGLGLLRELPAAARDHILSLGERLLAPIFAAGLESRGHRAYLVDAAELIRTDSHFGEARVDLAATRALVRAALAEAAGRTLVLGGFFGADARGATTILGRGASDTTASVVGAALEAERVEIWSDVDGVLAADPRLVPSAATVPALSYAEAAELSFHGAKVLHAKAVAPLLEAGIPLLIRNTLRPEQAGTRIERRSAGGTALARAVATLAPVSLLTLAVSDESGADESGAGEGGTAESLRRLLGAIARGRVPVLLLVQSSSPPRLSLALETARLEGLLANLEGAGLDGLEQEGGLGFIAAVGEIPAAAAPARTEAFLAALEGPGIEARLLAAGSSPLSVGALVSAAELGRAARAVHGRLVAGRSEAAPASRPPASASRRIRLVIAGASGQVARSLGAHLAASQERLARSEAVELRVVGAVNRRRMVWNEDGLPASLLRERLDNGSEPILWPALLSRALDGAAGQPTVFVDCTASEEVASHYAALLAAGVGVVTPNKLAPAAPLAVYRRVQAAARAGGAPFRYETTVGAALPVLKTARELALRGDRARAVAGVLSGTLSFVLHRVNDGEPFSRAVAEARERGMTEPHPREDLSGEDVARKLLILLRELGRPVEREEIAVEPLVPPELAGEDDPERFLAALAALDAAWAERAREAATRGERLVYAARFDDRQVDRRPRVGIVHEPASSALAAARPGENVVVLWSDHYDEVPLTLSGIGAGPRVTAAGVLSDILEAAHAFR